MYSILPFVYFHNMFSMLLLFVHLDQRSM
jgi:hypothetical protein